MNETNRVNDLIFFSTSSTSFISNVGDNSNPMHLQVPEGSNTNVARWFQQLPGLEKNWPYSVLRRPLTAALRPLTVPYSRLHKCHVKKLMHHPGQQLQAEQPEPVFMHNQSSVKPGKASQKECQNSHCGALGTGSVSLLVSSGKLLRTLGKILSH